MKKIFLLVIAALMFTGIILVGKSILNASNIESIEIEGNIQTLYLVDEAKDGQPDFQDAKLKIIYKSGKFKYVSMKDAAISADFFNTTLPKAEEEMYLTYKTHTLKVKYSVIQGGMYYLRSKKNESYVNNKPVTISNPLYSMANTQSYFQLV